MQATALLLSIAVRFNLALHQPEFEYNNYDTKPKPPIAETTKGRIKGKWLNNVAVFQGIAFAKPPVGELKLKKPQESNSWNGIQTCDQYSSACQQFSLTHQPYEFNEDCLYLNVFTPNPPASGNNQLLPVLIWFHGGGYETGSAADFPELSCADLAIRQIILVTPNYRLNFFGFFTANSVEFPPNLGLWDQVEAMRWVQKEIKNFGGDPNRVTIGGHGTGSTSASLHTYSPVSKGLFSRAILQSGTGLVPFALKGNRYTIPASKIVTDSLGCGIDGQENSSVNKAQFADCIRSAPVGKIWNSWFTNFSSGSNYDLPFQTVWAPSVDGPDGIIPEHPNILAKERKMTIKVLMGSTRDEKANLVTAKLLKHPASLENITEEDFEQLIGVLARPEAFPGKFRVVRDLLKFVYCQQVPIDSADHFSWSTAIVKAASDYWMNAGVLKEAENLHNAGATVYLYSFDFLSPGALSKSAYKAVRHGLDLLFLFPEINRLMQEFGLQSWNFGQDDSAMAEIVKTLWTNFVKSGNPNKPDLPRTESETWKPFYPDSKKSPYFSLNLRPKMADYYHPVGASLWNYVIPPLLSLPYSDNTERDFLLHTKLYAENRSDKSRVNVYFLATWILAALLVILFVCYVVIMCQFRQQVRSYNVLRRVDQLTFE